LKNNKQTSASDWQKDAIALHKSEVLSWRDIARVLDVPRSTVSDFLRKYESMKNDDAVDDEVARNARILVISDMHIPYQVDGMIEFLQGLKDKYEPTRIVCIGDELEYHQISFHDSHPDLLSAGDELKGAIKVIKEVEKMFPVVDLIDSNHGSLVYRKAKHHGIPLHCIKSYNEILGVGEGWKWHNDLTLLLPTGQHVFFHHGKAADGLKLSQTMGMCAVQGHYHEKFNIQYWGNSLGLYFSMQVGCLIDDDSYAFAYNNVNLKRPVIGCGLIIDGVPILEAFPL